MRTKILLALDGSATSTKVAEHVGKVICSCGCMDITLYHAIPRLPELSEHPCETTAVTEENSEEEPRRRQEAWLEVAKDRAETLIFGPARSTLKENGVDEKATPIHTKLASEANPDVALAIIDEAKAGGYDVVVVGRRGLSMLKEFIYGSVTWKVVHHLHGCAIWIVE